jgi:hypothetical protein
LGSHPNVLQRSPGVDAATWCATVGFPLVTSLMGTCVESVPWALMTKKRWKGKRHNHAVLRFRAADTFSISGSPRNLSRPHGLILDHVTSLIQKGHVPVTSP